MYSKIIKVFFDIFFSIIGIIFLLPLFSIIALILIITTKSNPFFTQKRPGLNGKLFNIYKFKTMNDERDNHQKLLPDNNRLTKFGSFLRKTSLDELPQLFNVLIGNMSLVGPRPLLSDYYHLYNDYQKSRHFVKPGITGLVQVSGRNNLLWDKRFELDFWYVKNISFLVDFKILIQTLFQIFVSKNSKNAIDIPIEPFENY